MTTKLAALALLFAAACGGATQTAPATPAVAAVAPAKGLQIKLTTIYVDDQEKALKFYTDVLGFAKKDDEENGGYRWLTVSAPGDTTGTALQLASNANPAAKAFQEAQFTANQPAAMFYTSDIKTDAARIQAAGAEMTMPPTDIGFATIAMLKDTCGNLIQITQLAGQ